MKYKLHAVEKREELELRKDEFISIEKAKDHSLLLLGVEEKLDMVVENYVEYEKSLFEIALSRMIRYDPSWSVSIQDIQLVNRRIANLLTVTRVYFDQTVRDLTEVFGRHSKIVRDFTDERNKECASNFGFRVMEYLRNSVQHSSLPVHLMSYPMQRDWDSVLQLPSSEMWFSIVPCLKTEFLEEDRAGKSTVVSELRAKGKDIALTPLVKAHIQGLGRIHEGLRIWTKARAEECESVFSSMRSRAESFFGSKEPLSLIAREETAAGEISSEVWITEELAKRRQLLARRNRNFSHLSDRYVTGLIPEKKKVAG